MAGTSILQLSLQKLKSHSKRPNISTQYTLEDCPNCNIKFKQLKDKLTCIQCGLNYVVFTPQGKDFTLSIVESYLD